MWQVVKPLRPHPLAVGQARNFCTRRLSSVLDGRGDVTDLIADAATIASELVTNAVVAGASIIEICLSVQGSCVVIEVSDDADGEVTPVAAAPTDISGRGLMVVAALARTWGVERHHGGGKHVWAELALDHDGFSSDGTSSPRAR